MNTRNNRQLTPEQLDTVNGGIIAIIMENPFARFRLALGSRAQLTGLRSSNPTPHP